MGTLHSNIATRVENDWLQPGVTMYWSHTDEDTYVSWLNKAGLSILWSRFIPEGDGGHPLVLAQKPYQAYARIHRRTPMDGVRKAEGG